MIESHHNWTEFNVKTKTYIEKWANSENESLTKEYFNKEGFVIKEEYQNELFESTSVYEYEDSLLISSKSVDKNNKIKGKCRTNLFIKLIY